MAHFRSQHAGVIREASDAAALGNLEPFGSYIASGHVRGESDEAFLTVSRSLLTELLRPTLGRIRFDEDYYRKANPDLAAAETKGQVASMREHYMEHGYFENRLPCRVEVDAEYYMEEYPDVGQAIVSGRVASPEWHFETFGFREGRLPRRGWSFADLLAR
jgi:hypothetical protein